MGCWNGTCYISKLPIHYGENVVMILVREREFKRRGECPHTCYPTDFYAPFGYPIYGKYDDYGGVEDIENAKEVLEYLKTVEIHRVRKDYDDDNKTKDEIIEITEENLDDTLNEIMHSGYFVENNAIEGFFVKRELYDLLIENASSRKIYGKNETIAHQTERLLKKEIAKINDEKFENEFEKRYALHELYRFATLSEYCDYEWEITSHIKRKLLDNFNDDDMKRLIELMMFRYVLDLLRMGYFCITGDGSQSNEMYMHTLVAKYILEYTTKAYQEAQEDSNHRMRKKNFLMETCFGYYESKED